MWGPLSYEYPRLLSPDTHSSHHLHFVEDPCCNAVWQFEATQNRFLYALIIMSIFLACYHVAKNEKNCAFVGPPFYINVSS